MQGEIWRERLPVLPRVARIVRLSHAFITVSPARMLRALAPATPDVYGAHRVPATGGFVLAVNHFSGALSLVGMAAITTALLPHRADVLDVLLLIAGRRELFKGPRILRAIQDRAMALWRKHLLRIPWRNVAASPAQLREWRTRSGHAISVVYPEGRGSIALGEMRPGSGRWLARMPVPTVPCACWHASGQWHVRFGEPIGWAANNALHDLQLGLNLAHLLPAALRVHWQADLDEWLDSRR